MNGDFSLPPGMTGRFAVVKLWPGIKTAEDECIARLKIAAGALGVDCVEIHADGRLIDAPAQEVSPQNVDFVLHLHYDTPKRYDAFSIAALWNPLQFYHEWGYERTSRNLTTHDDFISCLSVAADDHVARMVRQQATHLPPAFRLFHSTADIVHAPSLGDVTLFYAGINWEALGGGKSRHQEVLKRLDGTGQLRIYGPTIFQGVRVWEGYQSYVKEVPFDGVSMLDEISRAGVALVLSSQAHKESELMSNRLFESIAAGALVICDENPFAARHFGDALLYIDSRMSDEKMAADILAHLAWARQNPAQALEMIRKAQQIFREKFTLTRNLRDIYSGLPERKRLLRERQNPAHVQQLPVGLYMLMPEYSPVTLRQHVQSAQGQTYDAVRPVLVVPDDLAPADREKVVQAARDSGLQLREVPFQVSSKSGYKSRRKLGAVMSELLRDVQDAAAVIFLGPNEHLLSNHVAVLAGALQRDPAIQCAATAAYLLAKDEPVKSVHEVLDFGADEGARYTGFGRFIFRIAGIPADIALALQHLDLRTMAALAGEHDIAQQMPATVCIDVEEPFPPTGAKAAAEIAVVRDFCPAALRPRYGFGPVPAVVAAVVPVQLPPLSLLQLVVRLLSVRWLKLQWRALREHGVRSRWHVLLRRLGLQ